jgi:hypothetical protein
MYNIRRDVILLSNSLQNNCSIWNYYEMLSKKMVVFRPAQTKDHRSDRSMLSSVNADISSLDPARRSLLLASQTDAYDEERDFFSDHAPRLHQSFTLVSSS